VESKVNKKSQAERLFFVDKKTIKEISVSMGLSVKTVGKYLRSHPDYIIEKARRQSSKRNHRKSYQRNWMEQKRTTGRLGCNEIEKAILKSQHHRDVATLSHERIY